MQTDNFSSIDTIIADLESLIVEIENNPRLSSWVVRMTLKSIKDKAVKMPDPPAQKPTYFSDLALLN